MSHKAKARGQPKPSGYAEQVIGALMDAALPVLAARFRPDCCIAATRIAVEALGRYGLAAAALKVSVVIWNPPLLARLERGEYPADGQQVRRWGREDGSWSVGVGVGARQPGKWPGHLVAVTHDPASGRNGQVYLLDLTLGQANRPERQITLDPLAAVVSPVFLAGRERFGARMRGSGLMYEADPADRSFLQIEDYSDPRRWGPALAEVLAAMALTIGAPRAPAALAIAAGGPATLAAGVRTQKAA